MKLYILSDLHLEFSDMDIVHTDAGADVIVLAGDIHKGERGISWARETFPDKEIVYVSGNHEFYGKHRLDTLARMRIAAKACGVHFLDDESVVIGEVRFLGATLWTDFLLFGSTERPWCMRDAQNNMNDFRVIYEGDKVFSPSDSVFLNRQSVYAVTGRRCIFPDNFSAYFSPDYDTGEQVWKPSVAGEFATAGRTGRGSCPSF